MNESRDDVRVSLNERRTDIFDREIEYYSGNSFISEVREGKDQYSNTQSADIERISDKYVCPVEVLGPIKMELKELKEYNEEKDFEAKQKSKCITKLQSVIRERDMMMKQVFMKQKEERRLLERQYNGVCKKLEISESSLETYKKQTSYLHQTLSNFHVEFLHKKKLNREQEKKVERISFKLDVHEKEMESLKNKLEEEREENMLQEIVIKNLSGHIMDNIKCTSELNFTLKEKERNLESVKKEKNELITRLLLEIEAKDAIINEFEDLKTMKSRLNENNNFSGNLEENNLSLQTNLKEPVDAHIKDKNSLVRQKQSMNSAIQKSVENKSQMKERIKFLKEHLNEVSKENSILKEEVFTINQKLLCVLENNDILEVEVLIIEAELLQEKENFQSAKVDLLENTSNLSNLATNLDFLTTTYEKMMREKNMNNSALKEIEESFIRAGKKVKTHEETISELSFELRVSKDILVDKETQIEDFEKNLIEMNLELEFTKEILFDKELQLKHYEKVMTELKTELTQNKDNLNTKEFDLNNAIESLKSKFRNQTVIKNALTNSENENKTLCSKIEKMEGDSKKKMNVDTIVTSNNISNNLKDLKDIYSLEKNEKLDEVISLYSNQHEEVLTMSTELQAMCNTYKKDTERSNTAISKLKEMLKELVSNSDSFFSHEIVNQPFMG